MRLSKGLTCLVLAGSIATALPRFYWFQEVNSFFTPLYLVLSLLLIPILFLNRKSYSALFVFPALLLLLYFSKVFLGNLAPFYLPVRSNYLDPENAGDTPLTILYANLSLENRETEELKSAIVRENPDVVLLLEVDRRMSESLALGNLYPSRVEMLDLARRSLAIYSKKQFIGKPLPNLGEDAPPAIVAQIEVAKDRNLDLTLINSPVPFPQESFFHARVIQRRTAMRLRHSDAPALVIGNLNSPPWTLLYLGFLYSARLDDLMWGKGLGGDWHPIEGVPGTRIDHIMGKGAVRPESVERLKNIGKGNRGFLIKVRL